MSAFRKNVDANPTRRSLLERLKNLEDNESWRAFVDTYRGLIYSAALKAGLSENEALDAVQETFICVARQMPSFNYDPAKGSFKGWLLNTTQWRIYDQLRKRKRCSPLDENPSGTRTSAIDRLPDPRTLVLEKNWNAEWDNHFLSAALERVKLKVSARQYQIFDLYVLKKWTPEKISKLLGVTTGQIYLAKHRVSALLKKERDQLNSEGFRR